MNKQKDFFAELYIMEGEELSIKERAVYVAIACKSDFETKISYIMRPTISKLTGIKDLDLISRIINSLDEKHWIEKHSGFNYKEEKMVNYYRIIDRGVSNTISRDVIEAGLSTNDLVTLVSLFVLRDGSTVDYVNLYKACGMSNSTFYRSFKSLKEKGYISSKDGVTKLLKFVPKNLSNSNKRWVDDLMTYGEKESKLYKEVKHFISTDWESVENPNALIEAYRTGLAFVPASKKEAAKKEREDQLNKIPTTYAL